MPLGIGIEQVTGGRDRHLLADAGDDVLQRPALGRVIMNVVGGEDGAPMLACQPVEPLDPGIVVAPVKPARRDDDAMTSRRRVTAAALSKSEKSSPGQAMKAMPSECAATSLERQLALAFLGAHLAQAEQPGQPSIAVAIDRISEQARRIGRVEPAADQRPDPRAAAGAVHAHHARPACSGRRSRSRHNRAEVRSGPARSRPTRRAGRKWRADAQLDIRRRHRRRRRRVAGPNQLQPRKAFFRGHQPKRP